MSLTEEGLYRAKVLSWGLGKANSGTIQFSLGVKITDRAIEDDPQCGFQPLVEPGVDEDGNEIEREAHLKRTVFLYITPKTKDRCIASLKGIGYHHDSLKAEYLQPGNDKSWNFAKDPILLECRHEEWNGRPKEKWELARPMKKLLTREEMDQFNQMFEDAPITDADLPPELREESEPVKPAKGKKKNPSQSS